MAPTGIPTDWLVLVSSEAVGTSASMGIRLRGSQGETKEPGRVGWLVGQERVTVDVKYFKYPL